MKKQTLAKTLPPWRR